ncbi:MAG: LLM class flavin-dependent oxidoreductase [Phenylobacterium sp.]
MKFGLIVRNGPGAGQEALETERAGYDFIGLSDTQSMLPDVYCGLTAAAATTQRVQLGPWATNVLTRDPTVTAGANATIDQLSGGRAFIAIGTGRSSTANAGMRPATPEQLSRALRTIYSAFRPTPGVRDDVAWPRGLAVDESVVALPGWAARRPPIYVAASGPKALRIAAEMADGVVLSPGDVPWDAAAERVAQLRAMREAGPRAGDPFEVRMNLRCHLTDSIQEGRAALRGVVSAHAAYAKVSDVPEPLKDAQREYLAGYQWEHHGAFVNSVNVEAMLRLGLADYMYRRYAIIGDAAAILSTVRLLEAADVDAVAGVPPPVVAAYKSEASARTVSDSATARQQA